MCMALISTNLSAQVPTADAGPNVNICEGQSAQLNGAAFGVNPPFYFQWWCDSTNTACVIDSAFDDDPLVMPTATTWYYLQVTDGMGMQSPIDSVLVTVQPRPVVNAGPGVSLCPDPAPCEVLQASVSGASGPYSYTWTPSAGLSSANVLNPCARPLATTTYTLQAFSGICGSDTTDPAAQVTVVVHPMPIANAGPDTEICLGDTVQLQGIAFGAGPNYLATWSPSNSLSDPSILNPLAYPTLTTDYTLTPWSNGCPGFADTLRVTVHPIPAAPTISQSLDTLFSSPAPQFHTYRWCLNGQPISGATDQFLVINTSGTYEAKIVSNWGCVSQASSPITGVEERLEKGVMIFPNPASERIMLQFAEVGFFKVTLLDFRGVVMREVQGNVNVNGQMEMPLGEELPAGMYLLRVESENGEKLSRMVQKF